jgi:hypothetical protein
MSYPSNVRPFSPRNPRPSSPSAVTERLISLVVYAVLGYFLRNPLQTSFNVYLILGILYWAFVQQRRHAVPGFIRYHLLQAILMHLFLMLGTQIFLAASNFLVSTVGLFGLSVVPWGDMLRNYGLMAAVLLSVVLSAWMMVAALLGRTPSIPLVSQQVRYWA